jgi:pilus assembly protein CpaD
MTSKPGVDRRSVAAAAARAVAALGLFAALAGCTTIAGPGIARTEPDRYPVDYRQRHPIVIKEHERTLQVFIGTRRGELLAAQRADVVAFADDWRHEASGGIIIEIPSGTPNERAADGAAREIQTLLAAAGVPADAMMAHSYRPVDPVKLATVRLIYPRMSAQVAGPCGLWPKDVGPSFEREHNENREYWNFGCANQRALAAMVANPSDLVQPRPEAPIYTARRTFVLDKLRKGESPGTVDANPNKGKISDIGQ